MTLTYSKKHVNTVCCVFAYSCFIFSVVDPVLLYRMARDIQLNYALDMQFPFIPVYLVIATWSNVTFKGSSRKNIVRICCFESKII
jgi:hypothetical protein